MPSKHALPKKFDLLAVYWGLTIRRKYQLLYLQDLPRSPRTSEDIQALAHVAGLRYRLWIQRSPEACIWQVIVSSCSLDVSRLRTLSPATKHLELSTDRILDPKPWAAESHTLLRGGTSVFLGWRYKTPLSRV